nr:PREDICTED: uncharacterized protein LOC107398034 [Tribolium castaneum]|eukprot:XP_015836186.1 PREDICTED: uncharacterized protein LOC107398034 [Tribolium castaneum]
MNLNMVKTFFTIGIFFALTPFSKKPTKLERFYSILVFIVCNIGTIVTLNFRKSLYMRLRPLQATLWLFSDLTRYGHLVHIFVVLTWFKRKNWFKLVKNMQKIGTPVRGKHDLGIFVLAHFGFLAIMGLMLYGCFGALGAECLKLYQVENYEFYSQFFYMLFACFVLKLVLRRLRNVKNDLITLRATLDVFNDVFGAVILWNILYISAKSLIYLDNITKQELAFKKAGPGVNNNLFYCIQCGIMTIFWGSIVTIVILSQRILAQFDDILKVLDGINLNSKKLDNTTTNMKKIIQDVKNNRPKITASRFFQINKLLLFKIVNTFITFFLVLVQFDTK